MSKVTGIAIIRVDGQEYPTQRGATLNPGGVNRNPMMAGKRNYHNEEPQPIAVSATLMHTADIDIIAVGQITNATVMFECDNGQTYLISGAYVTETPELDSGSGGIRFNMSGANCERV